MENEDQHCNGGLGEEGGRPQSVPLAQDRGWRPGTPTHPNTPATPKSNPDASVGRAGARGAARTTCQMSPFLNIDRGVRGVADQSKGGGSPFSTLIGGCGGPKKTVFQPPEEPYAQKRSKTQRKIHIPLDPIYSGNHLFSDIDPYYRQGSDLIKEL